MTQTGEPTTRHYTARDIGYGVEEGEVWAEPLGEKDWTGKRPYQPVEGGPAVHLFDDELEDEEEAEHAELIPGQADELVQAAERMQGQAGHPGPTSRYRVIQGGGIYNVVDQRTEERLPDVAFVDPAEAVGYTRGRNEEVCATKVRDQHLADMLHEAIETLTAGLAGTFVESHRVELTEARNVVANVLDMLRDSGQ